MPEFKLAGLQPKIDSSCFIAPGAIVIGDVEIGSDSSLWYNSILRGDVFPIRIGRRTNIQDICMGHVTAGTHPLIVGDEVTVGHRAVLHGCTIEDRVLIGIGAIVMDGAHVGEESLIAAGAVVTPRTKIPSGTLAMGAPARIKRDLNPEERKAFVVSAEHYVHLAKQHRESLYFLR